MAKILLVEDDNNLREIYEARLQAEGYTIVSAMDGEAALVVAKQEKPDLVISDVMMPRISGFEMLDILRNTEGLKDVKVIMLTALGQAEDKTRADSLGADRYLVKSQVTLEDIVKAAHELLGNDETPSAPQATAAAAEQAATMTAATVPATNPVPPTPAPATPIVAATSPAPSPVVTPPQSNAPAAPTPPATLSAAPLATASPQSPATNPAPTTTEAGSASAMPTTQSPTPPASAQQPVTTITNPPSDVPTDDATAQQPVTIASTDAQQQPPTASVPSPIPAQPTPQEPPLSTAPTAPMPAQSSSDEEAAIKAQIENFVSQNDQTAPKPISANDAAMANAIQDLVSNTTATTPTPAPPKVITPPESTPSVLQPAGNSTNQGNTMAETASPTPDTGPAMTPAGLGSVAPVTTTSPPAGTPGTVATPPQTTPQNQVPPSQPAEDGVTVGHKKVIAPISSPDAVQPLGLDELLKKEGITNLEDSQHAPAPGTGTMPSTNPALPAQPSLPTTPHPPGHVISPNNTAVDPNTIAL